MGRSLHYQDAKGAYQLLGDMNAAEFNKLIRLDVFRIHYRTENDEYGLFIDTESLDNAVQALCNEQPINSDLMLLLFRIATWPQQGAFLLW